MIKKYFFFLLLFLTFFAGGRSYAVWNKNYGAGGCSTTYVANQVCQGYVVSANDFDDQFDVRGEDDPGDQLSFWGNFFNGNGTVPLNGTDQLPVTVNAQGFAQITATTTWPNLIGSGTNHTYNVDVQAKDQDNAVSSYATYEIKLDYAPIVLSAIMNGSTFAQGGTVPNGDVVTITCASTTNMSISPTPPRGSPTTFSVSNTGTYEYTGTFTNNDTNAQTYTVSCTNIGGAVTQQDFSFNTGTPGITNDIHISNISSTPNLAGSALAFNWNSDGGECSLYNYDRSVNFGPASGSADPNRASVPWNKSLSAQDSPSLAGTYRYYVKCTDVQYPNRLAGPAPIEIFGGILNEAWLRYDVYVGCPNGQESDENGFCHNMCPRGTVWDSGIRQCVSVGGCPQGQYMINGVCGVCPANQVYNQATGTCIPFVSNNTTCQFTNTNYDTVQCINPPTCPVGTTISFATDYTTGTSQVQDPNGFPWDNLHYQYRYTCNGQNAKIIRALTRPYTHFTVFNVSASLVNKSTDIDLNWVVEDPSDTCKIVAKDINTGNILLDTSLATSSPLYTNITTPTMSNSYKSISAGSYKNLVGTGFRVDSSVRFTASCINQSAYRPGYYQLVRDVYISKEKEQ